MNIYKYYIECVKENINLKKEDLFFKSDPRYNYVLEHVNLAQGLEYLSLIKREFKEFYGEHKDFLIQLCKKNDSIGKPNKNYFLNFCSCSSTNIRYIYQSLLILNYAKDIELEELKIAEIGGGYGGLCFYLKNLCPLLNIEINSYVLYDIPEVEELQSLYLDYHNITTTPKEEISSGYFLVSNYAFSELPKDIRETYEDQVINPFCDYGFLSWNACYLYDFVRNKKITSEQERPLTSPNNLYVYFK